MLNRPENSSEVFSFHLVKLPFFSIFGFLFRPAHLRVVPGLKHSENFLAMSLGEPIFSFRRFDFRSVGMFAWWSDAADLDAFLQNPKNRLINEGWHVRMKLYRRWGHVNELKRAVAEQPAPPESQPVVAVTLARLSLLQTLRFVKWGKPVEAQVRDHSGKILALAAMRPFNTFSTFSIWKNEQEMLNMVSGRNRHVDGESHTSAMKERVRKDFHLEFMTMRFAPYEEAGTWNGQSNLTNCRPRQKSQILAL